MILDDKNTLVLVGDGRKALFLRQIGRGNKAGLAVDQVLQEDNPATREQGTDQPGRTGTGTNGRTSAIKETDWHRLGEERFAAGLAEMLYRRAHAGQFDRLIVVAPPKVLGDLRQAFHQEVLERISREIPKQLTSHPIEDIARMLRE